MLLQQMGTWIYANLLGPKFASDTHPPLRRCGVQVDPWLMFRGDANVHSYIVYLHVGIYIHTWLRVYSFTNLLLCTDSHREQQIE